MNQDIFSYGDVSLSNRRMLDMAYETKNLTIIQSAILLSKELTANGATEEWKNKIVQFIAELPSDTSFQEKVLLQANAVEKKYSGNHFRLYPTQVELSSGQIIGLVGENGNGKTTLLRCLSSHLLHSNGEITYPFLESTTNYDIKSKVVFIPQRIPRWYGKLKDNLHFSAANKGILGQENEIMVDFVLERFMLTPYAELNWEQISSGYRTRFEIARIILQRPNLLILDEPLANLDINAQQTLLVDLKMLVKSSRNQMGIILSSQQLHEVEKVADQIIFLRQGKQLNAQSAGINQEMICVEVETTASLAQLQSLFGTKATIAYNGSFYIVETNQYSAEELLILIAQQQFPISYFRNITHSTKRLFNSN
jgi:ABC-2 type transport system ATP-binding protein